MSVKCDCLPLPFSTANQPLNGCHIYPLNQWATIRTADLFFFFSPSGTFSHPWQQWPKCFCTGHSSNSKNHSAATHRALFQTHFKYVFKENSKYQSTGLRNNSMDDYLKLRQLVLRISHQTCLMMCMGLVLICALIENTCHETKLPFFISDMFHTQRLDAVYWTLTKKTNFNLNPWKSSAGTALAAVTQHFLCFVNFVSLQGWFITGNCCTDPCNPAAACKVVFLESWSCSTIALIVK